jgi:pyruvate formate lyase activating enzyme
MLCRVWIEGREVKVRPGTLLREAIKEAGFRLGVFDKEGDIQTPCCVGGCFSCSVVVDGEPVRACIAKIEKDIQVLLHLPKDYIPKRIIHGPSPHMVGGKATPWWLKCKTEYIEVAIWTAGCNLRCPQCQNYTVTYDSKSLPLTPKEAAQLVTNARRRYRVDRMAISGGEPTLNRPWLIQYFKELKGLNPDKDARLHLDSNGTILLPDYIDELILEAGVTDIGIEPKGVNPETFRRITGIDDLSLAKRYLATAWGAIEYINSCYREKVFLGVGLPYNPALISLEEVVEFGQRLASINPQIQVCVLDYFPAFKRLEIERPDPSEMFEVKRILEKSGLSVVIIQTSIGHFGPGNK